MPNLILVQRDPAHMIRIACRDPLVRTGRFEEQHARLFIARHALLKDIQFSDGLQARLEACQRVVVSHNGTQGGGVTHIMRHFSLAPHRYESWTGPRRIYACCIHAVALLLADMAGDSRRQVAERRRAEKALDAMTAKDLLEVGLAGDFGEICTRFMVVTAPSPPFGSCRSPHTPSHIYLCVCLRPSLLPFSLSLSLSLSLSISMSVSMSPSLSMSPSSSFLVPLALSYPSLVGNVTGSYVSLTLLIVILLRRPQLCRGLRTPCESSSSTDGSWWIQAGSHVVALPHRRGRLGATRRALPKHSHKS